MIAEEGKRRKTVFTGTVTRIVRQSNQPLFTLYEIIYDVNQRESDSDSEEEAEEDVERVFEYELLVDYVNSDLEIIEKENEND